MLSIIVPIFCLAIPASIGNTSAQSHIPTELRFRNYSSSPTPFTATNPWLVTILRCILYINKINTS